MNHLVIAIDGPAAAGKSTVAKRLATQLGLQYLDTGAMYRAMTFAVLQRGVDVDDLAAVAELAPNVDIAMTEGQVSVDGSDATVEIRGRAVTESVSQVAANPAVRAELVQRQRTWASRHGGAVVEGRDIGSVVFPDATVKLFITASARTRAERRVAQTGGDVGEVERSIIERDRRDTERSFSPLTETSDMVVFDTTGISIERVLDQIVALLEARGVSAATATSNTTATASD